MTLLATYRSKISFLLRALCFLCVLALLIAVLNALLVNDNTFSRLMMYEMYTLEEPIDTVVLGPSVAYASFVPEIWERTLSGNLFVLGSSNQSLIGSYYLLKEFLELYQPKRVVYALHWGVLQYAQTDAHFMRANYFVDDFRPSLNRLAFLWNAFPGEALTQACLPFTRSYARYNQRVYEIKAGTAYRNYDPSAVNNASYQYGGKGYLQSETGFGAGEVGPIESYLETPQGNLPLQAESVMWLKHIRQLCEAHDTNLILMTTPMHNASMETLGCQAEIQEMYREVAVQTGLPLLDFTCCREAFLSLGDNCFKDLAHLNSMGAQLFSEVASVVYRTYLETGLVDSSLFYADYADMMAHNADIFNAWLEVADGTATARCTHGGLSTPEYEFSYAPLEEMPFEVVQAYSQNNTLKLSSLPYSKGFLRVNVRPVDSDEAYQQRWTIALPS